MTDTGIDYLLLFVALVGIGAVLFGVYVIMDLSTRECQTYEDVCYKTECVKTCWDKPTSCSNPSAKGHRVFCTDYKHFWENE